MFDWLGDIISGIGDVINSTVETLGQKVSNAIFDSLLQWYYESIYNAIADFFAMMGNMGAEIFDLAWVQATIKLFTLFGWALFVAGMVVAVFDVAIEYQNGRANIKATSINSNRQIKAREEQNKKSREKRLFRCGYSVWHKRFGRA